MQLSSSQIQLACYPNRGFNKGPLKGTIVVERGIEGRSREANMIEKDHNLEEGSIISADWIKKPLQCAPNQKTAHIRFLCASPTIANKLLSGHVFLANTLISVQKDLQEPIRCNICQEYGHIRNS